MKKLAIIAVLLTAFTFSAKAQMFDFSRNSDDFCIGFNAGVVGYDFNNGKLDKNIAGFGLGASISVRGIYVDFIYQKPEHQWGKKFTEIYDDHTALTINAGYKIPVTYWLSVTPLVGYSNETFGETDCATVDLEQDNRSFFHTYKANERFDHFNYGLGLSFKPFEFLEFGGVCTSHAVYGNISLNLIGLMY